MTNPSSPFRFKNEVPEGDNRTRLVCQDCGFIHYANPKIVVGAVATSGDRILLCRRAIEPRHGFWTIPSGFLEEHESTEEGACREAREETGADLAIDTLLAVYSVPHISQVQMIYRATIRNPDELGPRPESSEVELFPWDRIPWEELAFPTNEWALRHHNEVLGEDRFRVFNNPS